ncbi:MAG: nodulation protein NfeD [Thermoplasmata archaeon]
MKAWIIIILILSVVLFSEIGAATQNNSVLVLNLNMGIDPGSDSFINSGLQYAEADGYHTVIIQMNTPGGLLSSMLDIVYNIQKAEQDGIHVYTYVPPGGLAASAGSYIAMATDGIYMANGTEIGPSTPIVVGGTQLEQNHTENAMLALMQSLAEAQNRNITAVSTMVLNNTAYSSQQAYKINVITGIANSMAQVLVDINMPNASLIYQNPSLYNQFLSFISNATVDGIFILIGIVAILLDIFHASIILSVLGVIMIAIGLVGAQLIGASDLAIVLFVIAAVMMILEVKTGHGFLLIGGILTGIFATWLLVYQVPYSPNPFGPLQWFTMVIVLTFGIIVAIYLNKIRIAIQKKPETGWEHIKTDIGTVTKDLNPEGEVRVEGIIWKARSKNGEQIKEGEKIKIVDRQGLTLIVEKDQNSKKLEER